MFATRKSAKSRGATLVVVMMFSATVSTLCLFTLTSSTSKYKTVRTRLDATKAFYVAEGGVDYLMGNVAASGWYPARSTTVFPTVNADGSFESGWLSFGAKGGEFKITAGYSKFNPVPTTWTSTGFPSGYVPWTKLVLANRATSAPTFDRIQAKVTGRLNGIERTITTGIQWKNTLYGSAIVSDAAPIAGTGSGKSFAISNDAIVLDTDNVYINGGITANNRVLVGGTSTPLVEATAGTQIGGMFNGTLKDNLYGTSGEIPDFTNPFSAQQLFDFNRYKAAAAAGAGTVYANLDAFAAAMRAANTAGTHLQGIIYVTIDAAVEGGSPKIDTGTSGSGVGPLGINIDGTLVFHFTNTGDKFYKVFGEAPIHINAVPFGVSFDPANPATYQTGYPPNLPANKKAWNVDISGAGFSNFNEGDDLPALMFDSGTVDIHDEANICGVMYSPAFMEIENKGPNNQYFNGSIISGGGVYFSANSGGAQIANFDAATVDSLATFDLRGQAPQIVSYAVGQ